VVNKMVALGSSFAAGPGVKPTVNRFALRSGSNYAHLVASALGAELIDATVSGATTETILRKPQGVWPFRFAPQIQSIPRGSDADLVTITAGGNDLRYLGSMSSAAYGSWLAARPITRDLGQGMRAKATAVPPSTRDVEAATAGLVEIVETVRDRAPLARVLLVDYLTILGTGTRRSRLAPFTPSEFAYFREVASQVRQAFVNAAQRSGAELVDVTAISDAHAVGSREPWVQGFTGISRGDAALFHPTALGMRAVSKAILGHLQNHTV
jgi:lysophospholipase L1-like esterase